MLRASVSLSRKVSHDINSSGYTVTLDGEVPHPADDAEAVLEKVAELWHLAEEALAVEIERDRGRQPGVKEKEGHSPTPPANPRRQAELLPMNRPASANGSAPSPSTATPKQLQFLQNLGKRKGLARGDLDGVIAQVLGAAKPLSDLTKRDAGQVIDHLSSLHPEESR